MKKVLIMLAVTGASLVSTSSVLADESGVYPSYDGAVNFNGEIIQTACTVDEGSKTLVVALGKIPVTSFSATQPTAAGRKDFNLKLVCPEGSTNSKATVRFDGTPAAGNSKIVQLTADSVATKVGVQIRDASDEVIDLNDDSSQYDLVEGENTLAFSAYYYPTTSEIPTPGTANAVVNFSIIYQ